MQGAFEDAYPWGLSDAEVANVTASPEFLRVHGPDAVRQLVQEQAAHGSGWSSLAAAFVGSGVLSNVCVRAALLWGGRVVSGRGRAVRA